MRFTPGIFVVATLVLLSLDLGAARAQQPADNDLRDIRIGMAVTDLPTLYSEESIFTRHPGQITLRG
jgi:hypothetical protein